MKVLLINPPRDNEILGNNPPIIEKERGANPPLGLLYLAGYLEKYSSHTVSVIDSQVEGLSCDQVKSRIASIGPDVIGITAMTMTLLDVVKTIRLAREVNSGAKIVLGGPHVFIFPEETIGLKGVDYAVLGEGEITFKRLLDGLDGKEEVSKIPGIVFKENGGTVFTGPPALIEDLDQIPPPARHLTPYNKYTSLLAKRNPVTTMFTSRGCPFLCSFCSRPHLGKRFRVQSARRVVDEIEACVKMGIYEFLFYDDTFTINRERVIDICKEIIKRRLDIGWDIRTRVDTVDEEMIKHLKAAGCQGIHYGVESGTEKILKILNKNITLDKVEKVFAFTRRHKISILAYFMIGNPTETRDDISQTFKVMNSLDPDYAHITIFTPFPSTKIYMDGLQSGVIKKDYWREFAKAPGERFVAPHWPEVFSREELVELLAAGYKSFYMRPSYILKRMLGIRSFGELKRKIAAGFGVFRMGR